MTPRATNFAILFLLLLQLASGVAGFLVGTPSGRWVFWLHSAGGFALLTLVVWKWRIVVGSFARRGVGTWAIPATLLGLLFVGSMATGVLWSTSGLPRVPLPLVGRVTGLTVHVLLSLALIPFFLIHAASRGRRPRRADLIGRRAAIRSLALLVVGLVAWRGAEATSSRLRLSGAGRRFTGSREEGSFAGNRHPVTNWLFDSSRRLSTDVWQLHVSGAVGKTLTLSYEELLALGRRTQRPVLDCTGGWYTVQHWTGVSVAELLNGARPEDGATSIVVRSVTGYSRRFRLAAASELLLATHVEGVPLSAAHGFPLRLVAPGHRGYHWVKWVEAIEVSKLPSWWQSPFPLQ